MSTFTAAAFHAPPATPTSIAARGEAFVAIRDLARSLAGRVSALGGDWNSHIVPDVVARLLGGELAGDKIDAAAIAGMRVIGWEYVTHIDGVHLHSDHKHALKVRVKPAGRLSRLRRTRVLWWYNLRVGRPQGDVDRELAAIRNAPGTLAVFLCEAVGYDLDHDTRYELVRDRSTESRANVAAYVRRGHLTSHEWRDLKGTWARTDHPGQHPPRSFLVTVIRWRRARKPSTGRAVYSSTAPRG